MPFEAACKNLKWKLFSAIINQVKKKKFALEQALKKKSGTRGVVLLFL